MKILLAIFFTFICIKYNVEQKSYWIVGDSEAGATYNHLTKHLNDTTINYEVSSRIEKWAKWKMKSLIPNKKIDAVIIFLGANNYYDNKLPDINGILDVVSSLNAQCYWVGPPKIKNKKWKLNNSLINLLENKCHYINTQKIDIQLIDGIHPTSYGAKVWSEFIINKLNF